MNKDLPARIFLCGFMGTGKSTIGKTLAQKLGQPFYDLDEIIEERAEQSIPQIFKTKGEEKFRKLERHALCGFLSVENGIIALGGGALQNQSIVDELKSKGVLVFIQTPIPIILRRVMENERRPMLWDENERLKPKEKLMKELEKLYEQRLPLYCQADVIIQSEKFSTADEICNQLLLSFKNLRTSRL